MQLSIGQLLKNRGIQMGDGHSEVLQARWQASQDLKGDLKHI
ncbi:hypothetical protein GCM10028778_12030 [Barrientosiimonas marina]|uniref:Uncharacterized protein n=1 Tax=Lentibacillus kimchii TaxID=1542911 RepID=A0ABW2UV52_9BACI